jgi:hypothetical protein
MEAAAAAASCVAPPGGASFQSLPIGAPGASAASYPWVVNPGDATEMTIALVGVGTYQQFGTGSGNKTSVQQNTGGLGSTVKYWRGDKDKAAASATFIPNGATGESVYELRFSQPVCDLAFLILDCDQSLGTASEWTDQVVISPFVGAVAVSGTFTPSATTKITPNTPQRERRLPSRAPALPTSATVRATRTSRFRSPAPSTWCASRIAWKCRAAPTPVTANTSASPTRPGVDAPSRRG